MSGSQADGAGQEMLWVPSWGSASGTGRLHTGQIWDLATGSRETVQVTGPV